MMRHTLNAALRNLGTLLMATGLLLLGLAAVCREDEELA